MVMNTLYGTDPLRDMRRLQDEVNRLVQGAAAPRSGFPSINVYANPDGIVITAELPGVKHDDLEITVHRDTVTLGGERQDRPEDSQVYHRRERGRGRFVRTFGLPFQVDTEKVKATLSDGVLILSLQRPEADKPKRIQVTTGGA
jgi:HSP20 family protein